MSGYWSAVLTPVVIDAIAVLGLYIIANTGRLSIGQAAFFGLGG
jgi:ABC-type branched-subunit amino acid transport system permease subunit